MTVDLSNLIAAADACAASTSTSVAARNLAAEIARAARQYQPPVPAGPKVRSGAWVTQAGTPGAPYDMSQLASRWPAGGPKANICHFSSSRIPDPKLWANIKAYNPNCVALVDLQINDLQTPLTSLAAGTLTNVLTNFADKIKPAVTGVQTILRLAHEFNFPGDYVWQKESPTTFKTAWGQVADIMRPRGIQMMWCPNTFWGGSLSKDPGPWAPLASQVDVVALDGYNWGMTFTAVFETAVRRLRALYPDKPVWIAEVNVSNKLAPDAQQAWLEDAFRKAVEWKLGGICLFIRQHDDGTWIWADPEARDAIATAMKMPEYQL